jgi:AcrR family transcriptional regulator
MPEPRRRLSPEDRRAELLALGAETFGQRPYDEVRIDEIAERAGVSRALMYHYFPDKRTFFAAVVRAANEKMFEATSGPPTPGQTVFEQLRTGVLAYLEFHERNPHGAWSAFVGLRSPDPILLGIDEDDNERQTQRIMAGLIEAVPSSLDSKVERDVRVIVYGWLAFTTELCRQRLMEPSIDPETVADSCAHALLDAIARVPLIPAELADAVAPERR